MMQKMDVDEMVSDGDHPAKIVLLGNDGRELSPLPTVMAEC